MLACVAVTSLDRLSASVARTGHSDAEPNCRPQDGYSPRTLTTIVSCMVRDRTTTDSSSPEGFSSRWANLAYLALAAFVAWSRFGPESCG